MGLDSSIRRAPSGDSLGVQLAGLDTLDLPIERRRPALRRIAAGVWPKAMAILIGLAIWQLVVMSGWKPPWLLPSPITVLDELRKEILSGDLLSAVAITMRRAGSGYAVAVLV